MTHEEMDAVVQDYCESMGCDCEKCIIKEQCDYCDGNFGSTLNFFTCKAAYDILTYGTKAEDKPKPKNPYWDRVCKLQDKQREKGIRTYGQGLEDNHEPVVKRIQHIEEELVDALMYLEWLKDALGGNIDG